MNPISLKTVLDIHMHDIFNISDFLSSTIFSAFFFQFKVNSYLQTLYTIKM